MVVSTLITRRPVTSMLGRLRLRPSAGVLAGKLRCLSTVPTGPRTLYDKVSTRPPTSAPPRLRLRASAGAARRPDDCALMPRT